SEMIGAPDFFSVASRSIEPSTVFTGSTSTRSSGGATGSGTCAGCGAGVGGGGADGAGCGSTFLGGGAGGSTTAGAGLGFTAGGSTFLATSGGRFSSPEPKKKMPEITTRPNITAAAPIQGKALRRFFTRDARGDPVAGSDKKSLKLTP